MLYKIRALCKPDSQVHFAVRRRQLLGGPPDLGDDDGPGPKHGPKGPRGGMSHIPPHITHKCCPCLGSMRHMPVLTLAHMPLCTPKGLGLLFLPDGTPSANQVLWLIKSHVQASEPA